MFRRDGTPYHEWAAVLCEPLCKMHDQEISRMFSENIKMRDELKKVLELMKGYHEREKQLVSLIEGLHSTQCSLIASLTERAQSAHSSAGSQSPRDVKGGLNTTQQEINRIQQILAAPPVKPPSTLSPQNFSSPNAYSPSPANAYSPSSGSGYLTGVQPGVFQWGR
mmetsp:Transcript_74951/g.118475  ORF Transcript_74951/g.118475 Transcript_74951/m.118475 type:complete len:166 (-) Transcript_74951:131-628(-)